MRNRLLLMCSVCLSLCTTLFVVNVTLAGVSVEPDLEMRRQPVDPPADEAGAGDGAVNESDLDGLIDDEFGEPELPEPLILLPPPPIIPPDSFYVDGSAPLAVDREPSWYSEESDHSSSVAWGDIDLDGDLDLAVGNETSEAGIGVAIYLSDNGALPAAASWETKAITGVMDLAWGDMDGDGDLDLAVARQEANHSDQRASSVVFRNGGIDRRGELKLEPAWTSLLGLATSVAWGDVDGDADLDLAIGAGSAYEKDVIRVYLNSGDVLSTTVAWEDSVADATADVAWGDMDGDGDLDLAAGIDGRNLVFANQFVETGGFDLRHVWTSDDELSTRSIAWVDVDQDGHLDLSTGNFIAAPFSDGSLESGTATAEEYGSSAVIYRNGESGLVSSPAWLSDRIALTTGIDWGDVDADGDLDLLITSDLWTGGFGATEIWLNRGVGDFGEISLDQGWQSSILDNSADAAFADADNDGDLDVLVANMDNTLLYENQTGTVDREAAWFAGEDFVAGKVVLGDYDRDGDLDLAVSRKDGSGVIVYRNDGPDADGTPSFVESWRVEDSVNHAFTWDLAWGDVDGDGDLDLAVANGHTEVYQDPGAVDRVFSNDGVDADGNLLMTSCWEASNLDTSSSVAWGDVDGDGDLDLAFGVVEGRSKLYLNQDGRLADEPTWQADDGLVTGVAWGDVDGDGDLDLATAVHQGPNRLYLNDRGTLEATPSWQSADRDGTNTVAWGDVDGDGDPDLVAANSAIPAKLYRNEGGILTTEAAWQSSDVGETSSAEWADVDGDGDLDLVLADRSSSVRIYLNRHGELEPRASVRFASSYGSNDVATGDVNGDGFIDIATANFGELGAELQPLPVSVSLGRRPSQPIFGLEATRLAISPADAPANHYALSAIQESGSIPVEYTLRSADGLPPRQVAAAYAPGAPSAESQRWLPVELTEPISLPAVIADGSTHTLTWDVFGSGFFGRSDNVIVRMEAYPSYVPVAHGTAGPYQTAAVSAETFPMRVRGNQIRVVDESGQPVEGASVYRLGRKETVAEPIGPDGSAIGYYTDAEGYLQGYGVLNRSDTLVAVWPAEVITTPFNATVYHLSAAPDENGLDFTTAQVGGVQTLTVSAENPLVLFDLDLSLAWDARNDGEFLQKLENGIEQASAVLYDVTNGQVALGQVRVYQQKEAWPDANIVLYAANNIHPRATMGGIVNDWVADTMVDGRVIADAYVPGQIRMGPLWDPFNQSQSELSVDWWRALAHELSHYLLFLPDNYLGLADDDTLKITNCVGSLMTNAYDDKRYDEFLTEDEWVGDCLETMASRLLTGRTDWQTITTFFGMLASPDAEGAVANSGPESLPLGVTRVCFVEPGFDGWGDCLPYGQGATRSKVFTARPYDIRDAQSNLTQVKQGQSFLYKTALETFDTGESERRVVDVIPLGSTGSGRDVIMVRGADRYDRVCLFDGLNDPPRVGCEEVSGSSPSVQIFEVAGWQPEIIISPIITVASVVTAPAPITSATDITGGLAVSETEISASRLAVTVTLPVSVASGRLMAQVIPAYDDAYALDTIEPGVPRPQDRTVLELVQEGDGESKPWIYAGSVEPRYLAAEGFVRVWEPGEPNHEAVTQYFVSEGWDARNRGSSPTNKSDAEARNRGSSPTNRRDVEARNRGSSPTNRRDAEARNRGSSPTNRRDAEARNRGSSPTNRRAWRGNRRTLEAPVASGDGRVTIFNLDDIFAPTGLTTLQALSNVPSLPPWFTPVGKVYRFESTEAFPGTIAFHYLQREAPEGHEDGLRIYYRPDDDIGTDWQPLATDVDTRENLASARMPQSAGGSYALVATVELPALQQGWNLLAYTLPQTRTVESALASLADKYTVLYSYLPGVEDSWQSYDPDASALYGDLADLVNDLDELSFGHAYLIHASEVVTPYLSVNDAPSARYLAVATDGSADGAAEGAVQPLSIPDEINDEGGLLVAPARFFGPITGTISIAPGEVLTVTTRVDSEGRCGVGQVSLLDGRAVYALSVAAEAEVSGCGRTGRAVEFLIGNEVVGRHLWRNDSANYLPLEIGE